VTDVKLPDVTARLSGVDGNAWVIMSVVANAMREAGYGSQVPAFREEATSGDYDNLLRTCMRWVNVE
jgi:hypothetical protein